MFERCHHGTAIKQQFEEIFATLKRQSCLKSLFPKLTSGFLHGFFVTFKGLKPIYLDSFSQRMSACPFCLSVHVPCRILWLFSIPTKSPRSKKSQMLGFELCYILSTVHQKQSSANSCIGVFGGRVMKALGVNTSVDSKLKSVVYRVVKLKVYTGIENVSTHIVPLLSSQKMIPALMPVTFQRGDSSSVSKLNPAAHLRRALLLFPTSLKKRGLSLLLWSKTSRKKKK